MKVKFWGVRGSIACPGPKTVRYGGNTTCIEVGSDDGTLIILDAGTGIFALAQHLATREDVGIAAARLVIGILDNSAFASASQLLVIGGVILFTNMVAFALWFWDLDRGGAAERARGTSRTPACARHMRATSPSVWPRNGLAPSFFSRP